VLYRTGHITAVPEVLAESDRELLHQQRKELEEKLAPLFSAARAMSRLPEILSDEDLVNALAQYLALEPVEKQALLELEGPVHRARVLLELLEMKALADLTRTGERGLVH
jgi:Lon protease-like protein